MINWLALCDYLCQDENSPQTGLSDLDGAALIREVHVYGQSLAVGAEKEGAAQHAGLGNASAGRGGASGANKWIQTYGCHFSRWHAGILSRARL